MEVRQLADLPAFITKDGSQIREILAYRNGPIHKQSLAEASVPAGCTTAAHYHAVTEEIYFILSGEGRMTLDGEERTVVPGDAIAIPPGAVHFIRNDGPAELRFLCCCAPCYEHADTFLVDA